MIDRWPVRHNLDAWMRKKKATKARAVRKRDGSQAERNRERLIDAAIAVLIGQGLAKLTSASVSAAAGLHKPAFYAHFKNVDECLQAVALHIAQTNAREMLVLQTNLPNTVVAPEHSQRAIEQMLRSVHQHEGLYRLLARYQFADGPLGNAIREINAYVGERWVEHFWRLAVHFHIDARHFKEVEHLAHHVVAITYIAIGRVLDGSVTDLSAEAARVERYGRAIVDSEFRRMGTESLPDS